MIKNNIFWILFLLVLVPAIGYYTYPEKELAAGVKVDRLIVLKSDRKLLAYSKGELLKTYQVSLGAEPSGDKDFEGDKKTPEGIYFVNDKNPNSDYYKNLGISYPNRADRLNAKQLGKSVGGDIKIHGLKNYVGFVGKFHRLYDWTQGCIAVTDEEVDENYTRL